MRKASPPRDEPGDASPSSVMLWPQPPLTSLQAPLHATTPARPLAPSPSFSAAAASAQCSWQPSATQSPRQNHACLGNFEPEACSIVRSGGPTTIGVDGFASAEEQHCAAQELLLLRSAFQHFHQSGVRA